MIKPVVVGFAPLEIDAQFHRSEMSPGLFQDFMDGTAYRNFT